MKFANLGEQKKTDGCHKAQNRSHAHDAGEHGQPGSRQLVTRGEGSAGAAERAFAWPWFQPAPHYRRPVRARAITALPGGCGVLFFGVREGPF